MIRIETTMLNIIAIVVLLGIVMIIVTVYDSFKHNSCNDSSANSDSNNKRILVLIKGVKKNANVAYSRTLY